MYTKRAKFLHRNILTDFFIFLVLFIIMYFSAGKFIFPLGEQKGYSGLDQYTDAFDLLCLHASTYTYRKSIRGIL